MHFSFFLATENSSDSTQLQSGLREHQSSNASTASDTNTGFTNVLRFQPSFQKLSSNEQDELMAKLYDDEESMKLHFGSLVTATCRSVEKNVLIKIFCVSILSVKAYEPAPGERDRSLLDEHSGEIKAAKSIADIFAILTSYWNYLNYEILKYIVKEHGTIDDHIRLKNYEEELKKFCERRIFELPLFENGSGNGKTFPNQEKFAVKFDKPEGITCKEVLQIRKQIAKILHVNLAAFVIYRVDVGCVQLTFLIPKFIPQEIFPLSYKQKSALSVETSVIWLECGQYTFEV